MFHQDFMALHLKSNWFRIIYIFINTSLVILNFYFFSSFVFIFKEKLVLLSVEEKICKRKLTETLYKSIILTVFSYILMRKQEIFLLLLRD